MKKTQEIIGLPIISVFDGTEVGSVKNIIINAEDRAASFIVIDNGLHLIGAKVIPTDKILGIGEYAVMVEDESAISMISKIPEAIGLLEKNVQIKGSKVLTKKGRMAGEITEIFLDEDDRCRIKGLEFISLKDSESPQFLPDKCVITYGKNLVIVFEAFESMVADPVSGLASLPTGADVVVKAVGSPAAMGETVLVVSAVAETVTESASEGESVPAAEELVEEEVKTESAGEPTEEPVTQPATTPVAETVAAVEPEPAVTSVVAEATEAEPVTAEVVATETAAEAATETAAEAADAVSTTLTDEDEQIIASTDSEELSSEDEEIGKEADLFDNRQKQYLLGRTVTKTILDNRGNMLVEEGTIITAEIIEHVKKQGKMVQLVMNNKA